MKNFFLMTLVLTACGLPALRTDTSGLGNNPIAGWIRQDFNILTANPHRAAEVGEKFKSKLLTYCQAEYAGKPLADCLTAAGMNCDGGICDYRGSAILTSTANGKVYSREQKNYSLRLDASKGIHSLACRVETKLLPATD